MDNRNIERALDHKMVQDAKESPKGELPKRVSKKVKALYNQDQEILANQKLTFDSIAVPIHNAARGDGWANVIAGLGGKLDKRSANYFGRFAVIPDTELERIYIGDGIAARIIDSIPNDMTREWINIKSDIQGSESDIATIGAVLEHLDAQTVFNEALKWKRLYGGSIIVVGATDGRDLSAQLDYENITGIEYLRVIDRSDVDVYQTIYQNNPALPGFGKPLCYYCWFQVGVMRYPKLVHASRCIVMKGKRMPLGATGTLTYTQRFWGLSVLNVVYEALADFATTGDSITNILMELTIGKFKMNGVAELMSRDDGEAKIMQRVDMIQAMKSILHGVILDAENEDYVRDTISLSGIDGVLYLYFMKLSGCAEIPLTRLFGVSPAGMNSTGESDMRNYYDSVRSAQSNELKPSIRRLVDIISKWLKIETPVEVEFNHLFQLDDKERAEINLKEAQAAQARSAAYSAYVQDGVLGAEQVYDLEWKTRVELSQSYGPSAEAAGKEFSTSLEAEVETEAAEGEGQSTLPASPPGGLAGKAVGGGLPSSTNPTLPGAFSPGLVPDPIGLGMG